MQKNNSTNYLQEDEIDLKEIFKLLINSKKLIITITLVITTLGAIYGFQKTPEYKSTALIEIGQYNTFENKNILVESTSKLIQNLKIVFIHKSNNKSLSIKSIENKLIEIEIHKPSLELGKKTLDEIITYIENRHSNLLQRLVNQLKYKIERLDTQIEFSNKELLTQNEVEKLRIANEIEKLNNKLPTLNLKVEELNSIILEDQNNLTLLESNPDLLLQRAAQSPTLNQVIHSYKNQLLDIEIEKNNSLQEKNNLEAQLKRLESNDQESEEIFILSQEINTLELELEFLLKQNSTNTQLIGEIVTNAIDSKKELIILLSFIFGLFLSIIMVFINNYLKALKED